MSLDCLSHARRQAQYDFVNLNAPKRSFTFLPRANDLLQHLIGEERKTTSPTLVIALGPSENGKPDFDEVVLTHMPQVRIIARRVCRQLNSRVELEDLISAGAIGLLKAIEQFDSSRNTSLKTYADHKIRGAILDSIRSIDGVKRQHRKQIKQVEEALRAAQQKLQRSPREEEIAAELSLDLEAYQLLRTQFRKIRITSFDVAEREGVSLCDLIGSDEEQTNPAFVLERSELGRILSEGLDRMSLKDRTVLELLYFGDNLKPSEIALLMNISCSRVSQIKTQALRRFRSYLSGMWPKHGRAALAFGTNTSPEPTPGMR